MKSDLRGASGARWVARLSSALLLMSLSAQLAGCGQPSPEGGTTSTSASAQEPASADPAGSLAGSKGSTARKGRARIPTGGRLEREKLRAQGIDPAGQPATK